MYGGAYNSNQMAQMSQQMQPMPMQSNPNIPSPYISGWSYSQAQPMPGTSYDYAMQNPSAYPTPGTQSSPISYNLTQSYSTQPAYSAAPPGGQAMSVQSGYVPPTTQMPPNPYAPGAGGPIPPNVSINSYAPPDQGGPVPPGNYSAPGYQPYPGNYYPQWSHIVANQIC